MPKKSDEELNNDAIDALQNIKLDQQFENNADQLAGQLGITQDGQKKTATILLSFLKSYICKQREMTRQKWLDDEFKRYPGLWENSDASAEAAKIIVETIDSYEKNKAELAAHKKSGKTIASWSSQKIELGAEISGAMSAGEYAGHIESALEAANRANSEQIYTQSGAINMQRNLDGFIAEQHHVNTFNLEAAVQNKPYRAEVLLPDGDVYGKNSVDVVIKETQTGKIVRRYQAKYGASADATTTLFEHGDYRGQRRLVPKGQAGDVERSVDSIEFDGCKSKPFSKSEAKRWQERAQQQEKVKKYRWDAIDKVQAIKAIGKQSMISTSFAVGLQGARIFGRRLLNSLLGKENPCIEEDIREFASSAIVSGASVGLVTALAGGITVAAMSGWLGGTIKKIAKGNIIASAVCIGIDHAKVLYRYGRGEISATEALDAAGDTVATFIGGASGFSATVGIGSLIGAVLGPIGAFVGGFAGGFVGAVAGSRIGHAIYEGGKKIFTFASHFISNAWDKVCEWFSSPSETEKKLK